MTTQAERAAARAALLEGLLEEVAGACTTDEVRAVWMRALRTTAFCLLERAARERLWSRSPGRLRHPRSIWPCISPKSRAMFYHKTAGEYQKYLPLYRFLQ